MMIQRYFASMGIDIEKGSIKKVDKTLDHIENRLKKLGKFGNKPISFTIGNFDIDQKKLSVALGNALDVASRQVTFEISRFVINQRNLQTAMTGVGRGFAPLMGRGGLGQSTLTPEEWRARQSILGNAAATRHQRSLELAALRAQGRVSSAHVGGAAAGAGLVGRGPLGLMGPALALGLGGYGLSSLNQRNQEVVSAQLQSSAVVQQAGGTAAQGAESFQYLRSEANRVGFNFLDASGDYNKLISGLTGSGIGLKESQKVFSGFAELARVNKLDKTTQNRLFRALSQVAGKGKLMSEELTGQIAEALPGGTALFAQAYQAKIGGNKTGAEAIQQLLDDMKKGKVTSDILTYAGSAASQRANQGGALGTASQASQAEQARYQNSVNDMAVLASGAGVEEGFARIFRTLNAGLSESGSLVSTLAEGFNEATKYADDLLLWPQSFVRALEGKDSLVGDWLGVDNTGQLVSDWKEIKTLWADISAIKPSDLFGNFLPTVEATAREIAGIMNAVAAFKQWNDNASSSADIVQADIASRGDGPFSNFMSSLAGSLAGASAYISTPFDVQESNQYKDYVANEYPRGTQAMADKEQLQAITQTFQFQVGLNIDPVSMAQLDVAAQADALANEFRGLVTGLFEQASVNFPTKE